MNKKSSSMPYNFMVKLTPQEAWIEGKGLFLWLAFFFSEIGAGIYLVSLFLNLRQGLLLGWLIALVLGGGLHLLFLGRPFRALLMFLNPGKSELSRGLWVILWFAIMGFFQVAPIVISSLPWTGGNLILKVVMGVVCTLMISHGFLTMSVVKAIPAWNSAAMIPLSIASGIWVGSQLAVLLAYLFEGPLGAAEGWARGSLLCFIGFLGVYLLGAIQSSIAARVSVMQILRGEWSAPFYIGVVGIGLIIPLVMTVWIWGGDVQNFGFGSLLLRGICVFIGDLMMRFGVLKHGYYSPLI